ncbi:hypothetical protein V1508DRAFT_439484 [Lipomyces doorenjongii]|uniref:uncharacterized protein n=1 Tax=Lipomyces doorenjongii TaxID=383834 RepID=UPI0034CFB012
MPNEDNHNDIGRLKWTDEMHEALLEKLYEHFRLGKQTDGGGFKADAWTQAVEAETWNNWKIWAGTSGFGWDEEEELFKADKDLKNIRWHKNNVLHFRDMLREILHGAQATGQRALSVYSNSPATPNTDPALAETRGHSSQSQSKMVQETAIDILYRDYETRLDADAFVKAINVLESESKARIFTRLKADEKRDRRLEVAIGTEVFPPYQTECN